MKSTVILTLLFAGGFAASAEVRFQSPPKAVMAGGDMKITFAVSSPTDVEVAILDAKGKIVRHLAAGLLGKNAPSPFKRDSLSQEILWDGKDDAGRVSKGGPFRVRVNLGLKARLHKIIGWSGQKLGVVNGFVSGPDGTFYVIHSDTLYWHRRTWLISALNRKGEYLRQVFPGPANLPAEKRKGWPRIALEDGGEVPAVFHLLPRTTYPGVVFSERMFPLATRDGRLIILSGPGYDTTIKKPDFRGGRRLLILGTDGSVPADFLGPEIRPKIGGFGHIALSPDEKYVYATGFVSTWYRETAKGPCNVVYRVALDGSEKSRILIGELYKTAAGKAGLKDPQGIATDADGNIYVSDFGNDRIAVFKPDGSYLDEIKIKHPDVVQVSRKTGAIYVMQLKARSKPFADPHWYSLGYNWQPTRVVKFGSLAEKNRKAEFANPLKSPYGGGAFLALDDSGEQPVLWLSGLRYQVGPVLQIVDRGEKFELIGTPIDEAAAKQEGNFLGLTGDVAVIGEKVISRHPAYGMQTNTSYVYSTETGEYTGTYVPKMENGKPENMWSLLYGEMVAGADGNLYCHAGGDVIRRYDPEGKQLPFASVGKNSIKGFWHGFTRGAGMFIDRTGTIYIPTAIGDRKLKDMKVKVIGPDGKVRNECAVHVQNARMGGIAVDREGNIYVGAQAVPKGPRIPKWFAGKLPADSKAHHPSYDYMQYATIFKFPPTGGAIVLDPQGDYTAVALYNRKSVSVKNALWTKRLGYIGSHGGELGCSCETTRFDIDEYGRLFVPDIFRFRVYVLDGAGNEITHFGSYGNMDSRGPGSPVPTPEIPFGWPLSVECAGGRAFVADVVNRRVVAVRFEHAATAECPVTP